ncbi:MAG: hypothetical protein DRI24_18975, partial [Deltaproteobacteria bacterium]
GGDYGVAIGALCDAGYEYSIAIGYNVDGNTSNNTIGIGYDARAWDSYAIAIGDLSKASGNDAVALGRNANAAYNYSVAMGGNSFSDGLYAISVGYQSNGSYDNSVAIGRLAVSGGVYAISIGDNANGNYDYSIAIGRDTYSNYDYAISIGDSAAAGYEAAIAIGQASTSDEQYAVAIGANSTAYYDYSVAVGGSSFAGDYDTVAIGHTANADGDSSISIGKNAITLDGNSIALGGETGTKGVGSIAIGTGKDVGIPARAVDYSNTIGRAFSQITNNITQIAGPDVLPLTHSGDYIGGVTPESYRAMQSNERMFFSPPVQAGVKIWASITGYEYNEAVTPTTPNGYSYYALTPAIGGTTNSGASEPTWPTIAGSTVADGSITWVCVDLANVSVYIPPFLSFIPSEVGFIGDEHTGAGTQPTLSWGIVGNTAKWLSATITTLITGKHSRQKFDPTNTEGGSNMSATITAVGSGSMSGRVYWKGVCVEKVVG